MTTLADLLQPQPVSNYYDTRLRATDPGNTSQLSALNTAKAGAAAPLDPAMTQQIWKVLGSDPNSVDSSLAPARDYLLQNGLLNLVPANTGESNTAARYELGLNAPHNFAGYSQTGDTPPEAMRLSSVEQMHGNDQSLYNPDVHAVNPLYGDMTLQGNVKQPSSGWDTFWKVAPMIPAAFAAIMSGGALAPLLAEMPEAGGATAGSLVGDATSSGAYGGMGASAGDFASSLPSWVTNQIPNAIKGGISSLNANDGKFNPLSMLSSMGGGAMGYGKLLASALRQYGAGG